MEAPPAYHLFEALGIELEYMIVDSRTLDVRPIADQLLADAAREAGAPAGADAPGDAEFGPVTWSNELVAHVVEFKTTEPMPLSNPARAYAEVVGQFQENVRRANAILAAYDARLLPTAMHPWMNPERETRLWPHEYHEVYETFDRLFSCRSHGWANLQSVHLNLPFSGDEEFARLHAAIRVLLPILPALAASSPVRDGRLTGVLDNRLDAYRTNSQRVPSLTGRVIPEPVFSREEYEGSILDPIRRDLERLDPEGHLQPEFSNARGAIARFDRGSIEIRLLDVQEHPAADLMRIAGIVEVLRALTEERWSSLGGQQSWSVERLEPIFLECVRAGSEAVITDPEYLALFGYGGGARPLRAHELWLRLIGDPDAEVALPLLDDWGEEPMSVWTREGCLARRIAWTVNRGTAPAELKRVYDRLADCLEQGESFRVT